MNLSAVCSCQKIETEHRMDDGFTLIELLVVIAILPLVVGAISVALLSVFKNENQISNSLTSSNDAQVTSSTYAQDVQSAVWISQKPLDACNGSMAGASLIVSFSPDGVASASITDVISYVKVPNTSSTTFTVWRDACTGGIGSAATSKSVVARNALYDCSSTLSVLPNSVQTQLLGTGSPCTPANLPNGGWVAGSGAQSVSLTLNEPFTKGSTGTSLNYVLSAAPRSNGTGGAAPSGNPPILPLTLIGSCPSAVTANGHPVIVDNGNGAVGSTNSQSTCGSGTNGGIQSATPYDYGVSNPFQNLSPPTALPAPDAGSCTNKVCTAGYYPSNFALFPGGNVPDGYTFAPSTGNPNDKGSIVFQGPITLSNCTTGVTFQGGTSVTSTTYAFEGGLTISKCSSGPVTFGSASYIFQTTSSGGNLFSADKSTITGASNVGTDGLIWYMSATNDGIVNISNGFSGSNFYDPANACSATVLTNCGPYQGIVLWDASKGSLGLGQGTGTASGPQWNGGIYAPVANPISIGGGYNNMSVTFMVINNYTSNGSTTNISVG